MSNAQTHLVSDCLLPRATASLMEISLFFFCFLLFLLFYELSCPGDHAIAKLLLTLQ